MNKYNLSKALTGKGALKDALALIDRINGKYYIDELRAEIYCGLNEHGKALNVYEKCLERRRRDYLLRQIGEIYLILDNLSKAFKFAVDAVSIGRKNHKNYFFLGQVYYKAGLLINARDQLRKADEIKLEYYNSNYKESLEFLSVVLKEIEEKQIVKDDEAVLAGLKSLDTVIEGVIKTYNSKRGFGFINYGNNSCFFHVSDINYNQQNLIHEGSRVSFVIEESSKGYVAKKIKIKE